MKEKKEVIENLSFVANSLGYELILAKPLQTIDESSYKKYSKLSIADLKEELFKIEEAEKQFKDKQNMVKDLLAKHLAKTGPNEYTKHLFDSGKLNISKIIMAIENEANFRDKKEAIIRTLVDKQKEDLIKQLNIATNNSVVNLQIFEASFGDALKVTIK